MEPSSRCHTSTEHTPTVIDSVAPCFREEVLVLPGEEEIKMSSTSTGDGKPRLVIKRLELENFKSYAGVQHIGPFHKVCRALSFAAHHLAFSGAGNAYTHTTGYLCRTSLRLWDQTAAGNRTLSTLCSLSSEGERNRCASKHYDSHICEYPAC